MVSAALGFATEMEGDQGEQWFTHVAESGGRGLNVCSTQVTSEKVQTTLHSWRDLPTIMRSCPQLPGY